MIRNRKVYSIDKLNLTNPQKTAVAKLLTAQKNKYKKLLHETHERLHIIADMTTSLEFWYNVNGSFEFISPSCVRITGYEPQEFVSRAISLEEMIHPEYHEQFRHDRAAALNGESGNEVEYRIIRKDGEHRWVKATWYPVLTRKAKHIGIRISIRDITEYKRCQLLARAYAHLTDLIADELMDVSIFSFDTESNIVSWNSGAERLFGYSEDEILNRPFRTLIADSSLGTLEQMDFAGMQSGTRHELAVTFSRKDGSVFTASILFFVLRDHEGHLYQVTCLLQSGEGAHASDQG